jgi:outer membrane protein TolC
MRWTAAICGGLAVMLAAVGGCKQRCFVSEQDYYSLQQGVPLDLPNNPQITAKPVTPFVGAPQTVYDLDRKVRFFSLAEAIALSLENGNVNPDQLVQGPRGPASFQVLSQPLAVRVLAYNPAGAGANIENSLSKFDAVWASSMVWSSTDQPIGTALQAFQAGQTGLNAIVSTDASLSSALIKPLATGGTAGFAVNFPYQFTNLPARVNPNYRPRIVFGFDQPLLQGFGVEINQLRQTHPIARSILTQGQNGFPISPALTQQFAPNVDGILITRIRFDQSRMEFERLVNQMLLNVETAYWNLYGSYWTLYSREQALRQAFAAWRITKTRYEGGDKNIGDVAQARGQYELFRAQRLTAVDQVLENERLLRNLVGLPADDGTRLVPSDSPTLAAFRPHWETALNEAMEHRPELLLARQEVKVQQLNLIRAKNALLPDIRIGATYDVNSIGGQLDGNTPNNAFKNLASDQFNSWQVLLSMNMPIGFRQAHTQVRLAQLGLAQTFEVLRNQELNVQSLLGQRYRQLASFYEQIKAQRAQREAYAVQIRVREESFRAGRENFTLDNLLEAQRFWADALANEYNAIVQYNIALAGFQFEKGTILQHNNVNIAEGPVPDCVVERAAEHFHERTAALVLREHAAPATYLPCGSGTPEPVVAPPEQGKLPTIPSLWKTTPPLQEVPELPEVKPGSPTVPDSAGPVEADTSTIFSPSAVPSGSAPEYPAATPYAPFRTKDPAPQTRSHLPATPASQTPPASPGAGGSVSDRTPGAKPPGSEMPAVPGGSDYGARPIALPEPGKE